MDVRSIHLDQQKFGPPFQRDHLEQGQQCRPEIPEMDRVIPREQFHPGDRIDVEQQKQQQTNIPHRGNALQQRPNEQLQAWQHAHQTEHPENPGQTENGDIFGMERQETDDHDDKIEDVPSFTEKAEGMAAVRTDFQHDLQGKNPQDRLVKPMKNRAPRPLHFGERFQANHQSGQ